MSTIYKVAKMFQQKLVVAASGNLQHLKSIYQSSEKFNKTKDLWANSKNPYGADPDISKAVDKIVNLGRRGYSQAITQGMPASGRFGYIELLDNMDQAILALEDQGPFEILDPTASNTLGELKNTLTKARSEYTPVGIPAQNREIVFPQDEIKALPPQNTGAAYTAPTGADPDKLSQVVDELVNKRPEWGGFFAPTE